MATLQEDMQALQKKHNIQTLVILATNDESEHISSFLHGKASSILELLLIEYFRVSFRGHHNRKLQKRGKTKCPRLNKS